MFSKSDNLESKHLIQQYLNKEKTHNILQTCLEFANTFYLEGYSLIFTNEVKRKKEEVKNQTS